jgi:Flp pilus assembly protein CpaB
MDRQKILIIFGAAWVSAALLTWIFISKTHGPKMEATKRILAVTRDLPLGTRIKKTDIKLVEIREKDVPRGAMFQDKEALDRALLALAVHRQVAGQLLLGLFPRLGTVQRTLHVDIAEFQFSCKNRC